MCDRGTRPPDRNSKQRECAALSVISGDLSIHRITRVVPPLQKLCASISDRILQDVYTGCAAPYCSSTLRGRQPSHTGKIDSLDSSEARVLSKN